MPDSTINGLSALAAASVVPGTDVLPIWQGSASTTKKITVVDTVTAGNTFGTIVASSPATITQTWNNAGVNFTAKLINVTNTASGSASKIQDWQVGGSSVALVAKDGSAGFNYTYAVNIASFISQATSLTAAVGGSVNGRWHVAGANIGGGIRGTLQDATSVVAWSSVTGAAGADGANASNIDLALYRDSAGALAQRNGANAQGLRVYNTYTDASNYERASMYWSGNQLYIGSEKAGTGVARVVNIGSNPAGAPDNAVYIQGTTMRLYATSNFIQLDSNANIYPSASTVQTLGISANPWNALYLSKTVTAGGTTGAQTINKSTGSVNFAAAATSLVVTNSLVTTSSVIVATVATNDTTMKSVQAVAGSGSFTLYSNAAATAETRVNFVVLS